MPTLSRAIFLSLLFLPFLVFATEKIDINTAPLEELIKITYIGEVRAKELISLRPFSSLDDLLLIKGIGDKTLQKIKDQGLAWVNPNLIIPPVSPSLVVPPVSPAPAKVENTIKIEEPLKVIDLNTASAKDLQRLPGIGEKISQRIIEARPFTSLDDLKRVSGIGDKILERIKEQDLAWVDPSLAPKEEEIKVQETINLKNKTTKHLSPILISSAIALLSAIIILILKKQLNRHF